MISALETTNFKKVGSKEFTFLPGLNVLRGPNWSGKSSTLNAVKFALQGVSGIPGNKDDIPTWGSTGKCGVELAVSGHVIERTIKDCNIYKDGSEKPVATGHTACNNYLDELFGIPVSHYNLLHFSDQGETAGLLTIGATELQKIVERIANVTLVDQVLKLTTSDLSELKGRLEGRELIDVKPLKVEMDKKEAERSALAEEITDQKILVDIAKHEKDVIEFQLKELNQTHDANAKIVARIKELHDLIVSGTAALDTLAESMGKEPEDFEQYETQQAETEYELREIQAQLSLINSKEERYEVVKEWLDKHSETALKIEKEWNEEKDRLSDNLIAAEEIASEIAHNHRVKSEKMVELLAALDSGVCSACNRPFDDAGHIEETTKEKEALAIELEQLDSELKLSNESIAAIKRHITDLVEAPPATTNVEKLIKDFSEEMDELEESLRDMDMPSELQAKIDTLEASVSELRYKAISLKSARKAYDSNLEKYNAHKAKLDEYSKEHADIQTDYTPAEDLSGQIVAKTRKLEVANEEYSKASNKLETMEAVDMMTLHSRLNELSRELDAGEKNNKALREDRKKKSDVTELAKYLRESRTRFLKTVWDSILNYASTFCDTCTGGDIEGVVRNEKGKFEFIENGSSRPVTSASGAQKAFMGVGVRLGLSKALYGDSSFMVLDEPSADMSGTNSTRLVSTLMGTGMQIIYSTHSDLEELAAGHVIDLGEMV